MPKAELPWSRLAVAWLAVDQALHAREQTNELTDFFHTPVAHRLAANAAGCRQQVWPAFHHAIATWPNQRKCDEDLRLFQLQSALGCGTNCGSCVPEAKRMVRQTLRRDTTLSALRSRTTQRLNLRAMKNVALETDAASVAPHARSTTVTNSGQSFSVAKLLRS